MHQRLRPAEQQLRKQLGGALLSLSETLDRSAQTADDKDSLRRSARKLRRQAQRLDASG
jgi:hypothetical protein